MTNKLMTLSEALATGRPFKHKYEEVWAYPKSKNSFVFYVEDAYEPVWQVKEEEKPPMRVWLDKNGTVSIRGWSILDFNEVDITESLAKALAPYIKKELGL